MISLIIVVIIFELFGINVVDTIVFFFVVIGIICIEGCLLVDLQRLPSGNVLRVMMYFYLFWL